MTLTRRTRQEAAKSRGAETSDLCTSFHIAIAIAHAVEDVLTVDVCLKFLGLEAEIVGIGHQDPGSPCGESSPPWSRESDRSVQERICDPWRGWIGEDLAPAGGCVSIFNRDYLVAPPHCGFYYLVYLFAKRVDLFTRQQSAVDGHWKRPLPLHPCRSPLSPCGTTDFPIGSPCLVSGLLSRPVCCLFDQSFSCQSLHFNYRRTSWTTNFTWTNYSTIC